MSTPPATPTAADLQQPCTPRIRGTYLIEVTRQGQQFLARCQEHDVQALSREGALEAAELVGEKLCGHDDYKLLFGHEMRLFRCYDYGPLDDGADHLPDELLDQEGGE